MVYENGSEMLARGSQHNIGMKLEKYRPTMNTETLHSWASDAQARIRELENALTALIDEIDDCSQPDHWESYETCRKVLNLK